MFVSHFEVLCGGSQIIFCKLNVDVSMYILPVL